MKRLLPVTMIVLPLVLTACGKESDSFPADGRDFNAQDYIAGGPYTGRVIDDYLKNARVWLDMDGDGQYTPGPLTIRNDSGVELTLPGGEPTAMTGENGVFSLDVSELEQDPLISPDLDPRDYSLIALALPGKTVQQTESGDQTVQQAFMLSAPPGVRNVTPLTTLVRQRRVNGIGEFLVSTSDLALALGNINLVSDYVLSGDARAQAYARAFARFRASQLPQEYRELLASGDGRERFLSAETVKLMGISFARNALDIIRIVDDAVIDGDYATVDIGSLDLPQIELELDDSVLITRQTVFARSDDLPTNFNGLAVSAELTFNYAENGRLKTVEANGCMTPSLVEIVRVINADGKVAATGTQWVPTLSLNQDSGTFYDEPGTDERLTFNWENGTAAFETTTTCHGALADSSELGGQPDITYEWTLDSNTGKVASLTATSDGKIEVLTPDYAYSSDFFIGYTRNVDDGLAEEVRALEPRPTSSCTITADDSATQVVSVIQPFTLSGTLTIPSSFANLGLELDTREGNGIALNRPLRYGFQSEKFQNTDGVTESKGFEWRFYYPTPRSSDFVADQPNLIGRAYLAGYTGDKNCGRDFGSEPNSAYARVEYSYQLLSEYLAGQVQ